MRDVVIIILAISVVIISLYLCNYKKETFSYASINNAYHPSSSIKYPILYPYDYHWGFNQYPNYQAHYTGNPYPDNTYLNNNYQGNYHYTGNPYPLHPFRPYSLPLSHLYTEGWS